MGDEKKPRFYVGRLFWVNSELYIVTKMGQPMGTTGLIPMDVELVEW